MDDTSPPLSEATSWSRVSETSANPDHARVFIQLNNGIRFLVPLPQTCSIKDLHAKAIQRAERFGVQTTTADSFLQTTRAPAIALHGEDLLRDTLDLTEDSTFNLCSLLSSTVGSTTTLHPMLGTSSILPNQFVAKDQTQGNTKQDIVYVRWITLEDALSHSKLSAIKTDHAALPQGAPLSQLYDLAVDKFTDGSESSSKTQPRKVKLYLKECYLAAENNPSTLHDLGLTGSKSNPLNIFVDLTSADETVTIATLTEATDPSNLWGFQTTRRGICTLTTTLKMLMHDLEATNDTLDNFLSVLFELTHFPPVIIAFRYLHKSHLEETAYAQQLRLVAYAFNILCLQIAPSWVCPSIENALECSRQLVAWMHSLEPAVKLKNAENRSLVQKVKIISKKDYKKNLYSMWPHHFDVAIPCTSQEGTSETKEMVVMLDKDDKGLAKAIGLALYDTCSSIWRGDYYLDLDDVWSTLVHHRQVDMAQPTDFDLILRATALAGRLKLVGPPQLGALLANDLPVITLSSNGYVSMYQQEYYQCSEKRFFTWNAIQQKEIMPHANAGQHLMQKLEPIIAERKKDRTWEVDAWGEWNKTADFGAPDEAVVVCMDISSSMGQRLGTDWLGAGDDAKTLPPRRLDQIKEFYKNLAIRISALQLNTYLGMVTFTNRSYVTIQQDLTPVHLNFEDQVEKLEPLYQTAIFDGIEKARQMLLEVRKNHPVVKCRIILLTDGEDNDSSHKPEAVAQNLAAQDIVLDSVVVGTRSTVELFKISKVTGGYAFAPVNQQALFQVFLLETVVDIRTRPDIVKQACVYPQTWLSFLPKKADMSTPFDFPPCRPHPNQNDYFVALADADRFLSRQARSAPSRAAPSVRSLSTRSTSTGMTGTTVGSAGGSTRIFLAEIQAMLRNPHEYMDVYVSESNMGFWKVAMQGPPASAYANGVFILYLEIGQDFPMKPPSARFMTPVLHPNITKVC